MSTPFESRALNPHETPPGVLEPVPWTNLTEFIRQLIHDVRNDLNAVELETVLLEDSLQNRPATGSDLAAIRSTVRESERRLRRLSAKLRVISPQFSPVLAEDLFAQVRGVVEEASLLTKLDEWKFNAPGAVVDGDLELLSAAIREIIGNAAQYREDEGRIVVAAMSAGRDLQIQILESKSAKPKEFEGWGLKPFTHVHPGGFGLGLHYTLRIAAAHGGTVERTYNEKAHTLTTTLSLPLSPRGAASH
jgi:signal transduction histidine kinase